MEEAPTVENIRTPENPPAPYIPGTRVEPKQSFSSRYVSTPGSNLEEEIHDINAAAQPIEQGIAYLMQKSGPETGKKFFLSWPKATIGKNKENSFSLDDDLAAEFHAKIEKLGRDFYIFDLLSSTGIVLNGKKLLRPKSLQDFDEITIGKTQLIFRRILR
jgi:pSer/pThr/pTyr-binding forkhead associated (FHA) protein